jgi:hypothetical protein
MVLSASTFWNAACSSVARRATFFDCGFSQSLTIQSHDGPLRDKRCRVGFVLNRRLEKYELETGHCHWTDTAGEISRVFTP